MSHAVTETATRRDARALVRPVAVSSAAAAAALGALGLWGDGTPGSDPSAIEFFVTCAIISAGTLLTFGWLVPRQLRRDSPGGAALALSTVALLLVVPAFWSGLPPVLAAAGVLLGGAGRNAVRGAGLSRAAIIVGVLAIVADVTVYVFDWMSTNNVI